MGQHISLRFFLGFGEGDVGREAEKWMDSRSSDIEGGDASRRKDGDIFFRRLEIMRQKRWFSCACFASEEDMLSALIHQRKSFGRYGIEGEHEIKKR